MKQKRISLQSALKNADKRVREAAAKALNDASDELLREIGANMNMQGIRTVSGKLRTSLEATKATEKRLNVKISSEVFKPAPRRPGIRNPKMRNRYRYGVPYGRIIEFSPRINKPFFYTAWYKKRNAIKEKVMEVIGDAWSNG